MAQYSSRRSSLTMASSLSSRFKRVENPDEGDCMKWQVPERATGNNLAVKNTFANGVFEDGTMVITIILDNLHRLIAEAKMSLWDGYS